MDDREYATHHWLYRVAFMLRPNGFPTVAGKVGTLPMRNLRRMVLTSGAGYHKPAK